MGMSRLTPQIQDIQRRYANDPQKQQELTQKLYQEQGVSMTGGCLWSFIPMLILIPLYSVIRQPLTYILMETPEHVSEIIRVMKELAPEIFSKNSYYDQVSAAQAIHLYADQLRAAIPGISEATLLGMNFNFLGINLGAIPQFNIFSATWVWDWAHIGAFLIPCLSAGSQVLQMWISQKTNNSVITNDKGIQDEETAKNSQAAQTSQTMMWMMPAHVFVDRLYPVRRSVPVLVHRRCVPHDYRSHHDQPLPQNLRRRGCRPAPEGVGAGAY